MTEKIKGEKKTCSDCGQEMTCNEIEWAGTLKLQWQTNGKAHYDFDYKTKTSKCKFKDGPPKEKPLGLTFPVSAGTDGKVMERIHEEAYQRAKMKIAQYIGVKKACDESGIDNPAMVGMLFNSLQGVET